MQLPKPSQVSLASFVIGSSIFLAGLFHGCPAPVRYETRSVAPNCWNGMYHETKRNEMLGILDLREIVTQGVSCNEYWIYTPKTQEWTEIGRVPWYASESQIHLGIVASHVTTDEAMNVYAIRTFYEPVSMQEGVAALFPDDENIQYALALGILYYSRHPEGTFSFNLVSKEGMSTLKMPASFYKQGIVSTIIRSRECLETVKQSTYVALEGIMASVPNTKPEIELSEFTCGSLVITYTPHPRTINL